MNQILHFCVQDDKRVDYLCNRDRSLNQLIQVIGSLSFSLERDYFKALIKRIIGQQLSVKAASTIFSRVETICGDFKPDSISKVSDEEIRQAGVSRVKLLYIRNLTEVVLAGNLDLADLDFLPDGDVIQSLTKIKGIGRWTAEMFLIFSLGRLNVLSLADVGLQRAFRWLYKGHEESTTLAESYQKWSPYNTIAALYLWEAVNRGFVDRYDSMEEVSVNP